MEIRDLLKNQVVWLKDDSESDIIISSRVRLARNIENYSFKNWMSRPKEEQLNKEMNEFLSKSNYLKKSTFINLENVSAVEKYFLMERHLISREQVEYNGNRSVIISDNETLSVMINEEDHIRMQSVLSGLKLMEAYRVLDQIDIDLQKYVKFAFSSEWGYLTACPTNVGTGMRASVMFHLPCLVLTKQINKVIETISKLGLAVRGLYGEGTAAIGDFFQISNQITLGLKEEDIIDNIEKICKQIMTHEQRARESLYKNEKIKLEDRICRAYGLLQNSRIMSYNETIELLSAVRLGIGLGVLDRKLKSIFDELLVLAQPAHLQLLENKKLSPVERDVKRAEMIRNKITK